MSNMSSDDIYMSLLPNTTKAGTVSTTSILLHHPHLHHHRSTALPSAPSPSFSSRRSDSISSPQSLPAITAAVPSVTDVTKSVQTRDNHPMNATTTTAPLLNLLQPDHLLAPGAITIVRDSTDASDSLSLLLHLSRALVARRTLTPRQILLLTTRTRSTSTSASRDMHDVPPDPNIFPPLPRTLLSSLSSCTPINPHPHFTPGNPPNLPSLLDPHLPPSPQTQSPTASTLLLIECLHTVRFSFSVDPLTLLHTLSNRTPNPPAIVVAAPTESGMDADISSIATLARNVIDLSDLRTGVATDIHGHISLPKRNGRWIPSARTTRYHISDTLFNITL